MRLSEILKEETYGEKRSGVFSAASRMEDHRHASGNILVTPEWQGIVCRPMGSMGKTVPTKRNGRENRPRPFESRVRIRREETVKLTPEQKAELLPAFQKAVQAKIDQWDHERFIERVLLGARYGELDGMNEGLDPFAVSYDKGSQATADDLQHYIDGLEVKE